MRCNLADQAKTNGSGPADAMKARLEQLNELRDQGYLTPEEYEQKRNEIMGEI